MNSNRIFGLPDSPTADNDATSKKYVDGNLTSGSIVNNPSVTRNDAIGNNIYLIGNLISNMPGNGVTARGNLYVDAELYYNPSADTLYATKFSGALTGNATSATTATTATTSTYASRATSNKFSINGGSGYSDDIQADTMLDLYDKGWGYGTRIRMRGYAGNNFTIGTGADNGECYVWNEKATNLVFGTSAAYRMTITGAGRVGIGTTSPRYPLHVSGYVRDAVAGRWYARNLQQFKVDLGEWPVAMFCDDTLGVGGDIVFNSDKRIKKNVKDIDANTALSQIRQIRPKIYNYIDYRRKENGDVYGFIAQDVKDVILNSTMCTKDYIPNFYCQGNICVIDASNHIYEISSENDLSFEKVIDDSGNEVLYHKVKIYGYDNNTDYICSVLQVNNPKNIRIKLEKEYKFADDEENKYKIFIYGQEIYDFHCLEKNAVWTVATAALQEVDRQQQADKIRIAELEAKVSIFESKMVEQQSLINDILERLKTLEKV
jgi:hypothetical protein